MTDKLPINHMRHIENFVSGSEECEAVAVLVAGTDEWSVQKAIELIAAAPQMYDVLHDLIEVLTACALALPLEEVTLLDTIEAADLNVQRAIAAARGGVLQSDLRRDKYAA
jgi:hypothetical protein